MKLIEYISNEKLDKAPKETDSIPLIWSNLYEFNAGSRFDF